MHCSIAHQTITFYPTREAAVKLANANQAMDEDSDYRVEEGARGYFVAVYDDGQRTGTL